LNANAGYLPQLPGGLSLVPIKKWEEQQYGWRLVRWGQEGPGCAARAMESIIIRISILL
jgi:hypothetical protein